MAAPATTPVPDSRRKWSSSRLARKLEDSRAPGYFLTAVKMPYLILFVS